MGFYLRKSVRVGPLRFNLSKSGIGVSAGIPGFRIGMGPRGNYIHAGRGGVYYRATIPSAQTRPSSEPARAPGSPLIPPADSTLGPTREIESGAVLAMSDESSEGLLRELRDKRRVWRVWPMVMIGGVAVLLSFQAQWGPVLSSVVGVVVAIATGLAYQRDLLRKTTVIMYDMTPEAQADYERLVTAVRQLGAADSLWHVPTTAEVRDSKYHAGAQAVITRSPTQVGVAAPSFVRCNIDVPSLGVGRQRLFFFPERVLVFDSGQVGAIPYQGLQIERGTTRFIESGGTPRDSRVVGKTWRYVNKNGGPDKRFKDNRELPICEYETLHFASASGLNELLHVSRVGAGQPLCAVVVALQQPRRDAVPVRV